jgi:hypothetical protein
MYAKLYVNIAFAFKHPQDLANHYESIQYRKVEYQAYFKNGSFNY